jgi:hypothetical protein
MAKAIASVVCLTLNNYEAKIVALALHEWAEVHKDASEDIDTTPIEIKAISDRISNLL